MVKWHNIFIALPLLVVALIISQLGTQVCSHGAVILELGGYRLDQDIRDIKAEMEDLSYMLDAGPFTRMFSDEKMFRARQVDLLGEKWECFLGVTNNRIYKIALSGGITSNTFDKAKIYFISLYKQPTGTKSNQEVNACIWDLPSINVFITQHKPSYVVNIIATSKSPINKTNQNMQFPK
jgi:hypothetical protein